ncbi:MAG: T9SS type A sorting domain-containing protein [Bernardetiaceae bacterium]|nr:T9SS type A sorting domain-containing protein [Bernardetiaceae bacterium]
MKFSIFFIGILLLIWSVQAQEVKKSCHTMQNSHWEKHKEKLPGASAFEQRMQQLKQMPQIKSIDEEGFTIPVIVHIVHNGEPIGEGANISTAQVYSQIEVMNEDFSKLNANANQTLPIFAPVAANANIRFVLATVTPDGRPLEEPGIHRINGQRLRWNIATANQTLKPSTIWNPEQYMNIWTVNFDTGVFGFAQFPTMSTLAGLEGEPDDADTDGIVINYRNFGDFSRIQTPQLEAGGPNNRGRTATHEIGHFLGLLHTWGFARSCAADDFCDDTPLCNSPNFGCNLNSESCGSLDMIQNFMDYTTDSCMTLFTQEQVQRMHIVLTNSPRRQSLTTSTVANPINEGIFVNFNADKTQVCEGGMVQFQNKTQIFGNSRVSAYQWEFPGGLPDTSSDENPLVTYETPGVYAVRLLAISHTGEENDELTREAFIRVLDTDLAVTGSLFENFENGLPEGDNVWRSESSTNDGWRVRSGVSAFNEGNQSLAIENFFQNFEADTVIFRSPLFRKDGRDIFKVTFDVAYAARMQRSDSLLVFLTRDCGGSYEQIFKKGGSKLATAPPRNEAFIPNPNQWRTETAYIDARSEDSEFLQIIFVNKGNFGNNLFIDNIRIEEIADLAAPRADFITDYPLYLAQEPVLFHNLSERAFSYAWTFEQAIPPTSEQFEPIVSYGNEGQFDVSLLVENATGTGFIQKTNYLQIKIGNKLDNRPEQAVIVNDPNGGFVGGKNNQTTALAELFSGFGIYEQLIGADIFFGKIDENALTDKLQVAVWDMQGEGGTPGNLIYTQDLFYMQIAQDISANRFTRVVFDTPLEVPPNFYIGLLWENNVAEFAVLVGTQNGRKGWERNSRNSWQPYDLSPSEGGRGLNLSHQIQALVTPEQPISTGLPKTPKLPQIKLYPNPTHNHFNITSENSALLEIQIFNSIGQLIIQKQLAPIQNTQISVSHLSPGLYLCKIYTDKGWITRSVIIE